MLIDVSPMVGLVFLVTLIGLQLLPAITLDSQSRCLRQVRRYLWELSKVVQQQAQVIEQLRPSQHDDLAPAPSASQPAEVTEDHPSRLTGRSPCKSNQSNAEIARAMAEHEAHGRPAPNL